MHLIRTSDLKGWAATRAAQGQLPYLIKSLIYATVHPDKIRIPSGDAVWVPGFDGLVVVNNQQSLFVPSGVSVWEFGTDDDFRGKATEDFEKRSQVVEDSGEDKNILGEYDRHDVTFVFVTPHIWPDSAPPQKSTSKTRLKDNPNGKRGTSKAQPKDKWIAERKAREIWKDVRVIDGVDLEDWLEEALSVSLLFASDLGIAPPEGLNTAEAAWLEWSHLTTPPLSEALVVAGREEQERDLIGRLSGPVGIFTVRGDSPREALGFVLAALRRFKSVEGQQTLLARLLVAADETVVSRIRHPENLIIVLKRAKGNVPYAPLQGYYCIVPEGNDARAQQNVITLARPSHRQFTQALGGLALPEDDAERWARECGLSVTILQRRHAQAFFERPEWSNDAHTAALLPALLAGRWNDRNTKDRDILTTLADAPNYHAVVQPLQAFISMDEPPVRSIEEMWTLTAPVDAFHLLARYLTRHHLEQFRTVFRRVFGQIDPKVDIPLDEWIYHDIKGEQGHSAWLRTGLAETLLLIAERGSAAHLTCISSPERYAEEVIHGLPGLNDDWRMLASLRDQYHRLMEAAPHPLLDSLERLLEAKPEDVRKLFAEGGIYAGPPMHTALLRGLEVLAWSPEYLLRVALILAQLARIDPGSSKWLNRPANSLGQIFLWWNPDTYAILDQRLTAIDLILSQEPEVGWALLTKLLPSVRPAVSHGTAKPRWRDFGDLPEDVRTPQGQTQYLSAIVSRALDRVGSDPPRWAVILEALRAFNTTQQERALGLLDAVAKEALPDQMKAELWKVLHDFISHHRTFREQSWVLPETVLEQLERVLAQLDPDDPIERHRWLFDAWLPHLPVAERDIQVRHAQADALRQAAAHEILMKDGLDGLVRLGTTCKYPMALADIAVPLLDNLDAVCALVVQSLSTGDHGISFAGFLSGKARDSYGEAWSAIVSEQAAAQSWSSTVIASLLLWWPEERSTWEAAASLGVANDYWRQKPLRFLPSTREERMYELDRLIEVGHAAESFSHIEFEMEALPTQALVKLFDASLDEMARMQTAEEIQRLELNSYHISQFLGHLHQRADLPRVELARREYRVLPLLGPIVPAGLTLHEFLVEDPDFFVDVLCDVYLPASRDKSQDAKPTPEVQARASAGYRLLQSMTKLPGQRDETYIDEETLVTWINAVREKATRLDRAVVADVTIGELLAHTPNDSEDGGWPHRVVRNVIVSVASREVENGLTTGRHNLRGVHWTSLDEGGAQERELATQYRSWAKMCQATWPRMANVLERIARSWDEEAGWEDTQAEQRKLD